MISIFPSSEEPAFVSISARPMPGSVAWVRVGSQGLMGVDLASLTDLIAADLKSEIGVIESGVLPPEREPEYDREETRRLEREIQELLEALASDPASLETLSAHIYLRELKLQYMTDLGC